MGWYEKQKSRYHTDSEYREKIKAAARKSYQKNKAEQVARKRFRVYGMTQEQYDQLLEDQGGVCAICQNECPTGYALAIDHCHETKEIRGLLCGNCNNGLGRFKDSTKLMKLAIEYLEK